MEKKSTKQRILEEALDLFSLNGYEATSVGDIADRVGIKKASLYSHFESKEAIFNEILELGNKLFEEKSIFSKTNWENKMIDHTPFFGMSVDEVASVIVGQAEFLTGNEYISKIRKLMTIEQYRNERITALQEKRVYDDVLSYHMRLIEILIKNGILKDGDVKIMAIQYMSPISLILQRIDRNPGIKEEAYLDIKKHIKQFYELYKKEGK